jgi:hypothetical protein
MPPKKVQPTRSGPIAGVNPELALKEFTSLLEKSGEILDRVNASEVSQP